MTLVEWAGGLVAGFIMGVGASIFYLRWKMRRQLGNLEEQMDALSGLADEVSEDLEPGEEEK